MNGKVKQKQDRSFIVLTLAELIEAILGKKCHNVMFGNVISCLVSDLPWSNSIPSLHRK